MSSAGDIKKVYLHEGGDDESTDTESVVSDGSEETGSSSSHSSQGKMPGGSDLSDSASEASSTGSYNTIDLLGGDPLFLVLSKFFMSEDGRNIADILEDISYKLEKLVRVSKKK